MTEFAPLTRVIFDLAARSIEAAVLSTGNAPAIKDLDDFEQLLLKGKDKPERNAKAVFMTLFLDMARYGQISPKHFSSEMDGFYGFKIEFRNKQLRVACFSDGRKWILTHGFEKPGAQRKLGRWPQNQIERAKAIRREYENRKSDLEQRKWHKR